MPRISFSAMWSEDLRRAILARQTESYPMDLVGEDARALSRAVNVGIDSYLEAVTDSTFSGRDRTLPDGRVLCRSLDCEVSPEDLCVIVRRLLDGDGCDTDADFAEAASLASGICETLGIELI